MSKNYVLVSGLVFGVVAVAQASRALMQLPVHVGGFEVASLQVNFNDVAVGDAERSMRLFAEQVMPLVSGSSSKRRATVERDDRETRSAPR